MWRLLALVLVAGSFTAAAQTPVGSADLIEFRGQVVNEQNKAPVRRAMVILRLGRQEWTTFSDGEGRFQFRNRAPGQYTIEIDRDGFQIYSARVEGPEIVAVLRPQGVVTGKVIDGFGQPLRRARIRALRADSDGRYQSASEIETTDLGEYRLSGLDPGAYVIRATYREGRTGPMDPFPMIEVEDCHGGCAKPAAVTVNAGAVVPRIDFVLNPARPYTVKGALKRDDGSTVKSAMIQIRDQFNEPGGMGRAQDGEFSVQELKPGKYVITAESMKGEEPFSGTLTVDVRDRDLDGLEIVVRSSPAIGGELRMLNGAKPPTGKITFFRVGEFAMETAKPGADGKFEVALHPGEYMISLDQWSKCFNFKWVLFDGKPVTDWKLRVTGETKPKQLIFALESKGETCVW